MCGNWFEITLFPYFTPMSRMLNISEFLVRLQINCQSTTKLGMFPKPSIFTLEYYDFPTIIQVFTKRTAGPELVFILLRKLLEISLPF